MPALLHPRFLAIRPRASQFPSTRRRARPSHHTVFGRPSELNASGLHLSLPRARRVSFPRSRFAPPSGWPSPSAVQALLGRGVHAQGRRPSSRLLIVSPRTKASRQSLPLWGGTGGAPLPPRHPPRGFRKSSVLQHLVSLSRHRLTPACSGLAALAPDARR
jgi:hypothetical protein